jgi:hypothetical protein
VNGELEGEATVFGANGDKLVFSYKHGKRFGLATYFWYIFCSCTSTSMIVDVFTHKI